MDLSDFELLFKSHHARLCNLSFKIVGEREVAEEIVQDLFIKLWNKKETHTIQNPTSYINKSIVNASLNYLKVAKKRRLFTIDSSHELSQNIVEEEIEMSELRSKIDLAIKKLPAKCQTIFTLSRFDGMPSKEIATTLGISTKTVDNQIGIALNKLREELKPYLTLQTLAFLILIIIFLLFII